MAPKAGFATSPQSFEMRVNIVGHASPRWKGARNEAEAAALNKALSDRRAKEVETVSEATMRERLGSKVRIHYKYVFLPVPGNASVMVDSRGVGSRPGNFRTDNDAIDRRVDVSLETIVTSKVGGTISLPPALLTQKSTSWSLAITKLRSIAVGVAHVDIEFVLKNRTTNATMAGRASLWGGGVGYGVIDAGKSAKKQIVNLTMKQAAEAVADFIGRGEVPFYTRVPMGFGDFDGHFMRLGKVSAALVVKSTIAYATFVGVDHHPDALVFQSSTGLGYIDLEGWVASGVVHLLGPRPEDYIYVPRDGTVSNSITTNSDKEQHIALFPTESASLPSGEKSRLQTYVRDWLRLNGWV